MKGVSTAGIRELDRLFQAREVSPLEVAREIIETIDALEPRLHAFAHVNPDRVLAAARESEGRMLSGDRRGVLDGIPIGLKDLFWTTDAPTLAGTRVLSGSVVPHDATAVARLRAAGSVIVGKLHMSEAAIADHHPDYPVPVNPWDPRLWVGASSSGCGAATAAGMCVASLATDTGGSIRFPATMNGLTGIKPTWGRVSRSGVYPFAESLDHVGVMARSAWDCGAVLEAIAGPDPADPTALPTGVPRYIDLVEGLAGMRIGVDDAACDGFDGEVVTTYREVGESLRGLGAELVPMTFPDPAEVVEDWWPATAVEAAASLSEIFPPDRARDYGQEVAESLDLGKHLSAVDYERILRRRRGYRGALALALSRVDVALAPVMGLAAPSIRRMSAFPMLSASWRRMVMPFTCPFDAAGVPALAFPTGLSATGGPLGLQLVGPDLSEAILFRVVAAYQETTAHHRRMPPST